MRKIEGRGLAEKNLPPCGITKVCKVVQVCTGCGRLHVPFAASSRWYSKFVVHTLATPYSLHFLFQRQTNDIQKNFALSNYVSYDALSSQVLWLQRDKERQFIVLLQLHQLRFDKSLSIPQLLELEPVL